MKTGILAIMSGIIIQFLLITVAAYFQLSPEGGASLNLLTAQWWIHAVILSFLLLWTIFEEWLFRGLLWKLFAYLGDYAALISVSVLFALAHFTLGPIDVLLLLPFSFILGLWRLKAGLKASMLCHLAFNIAGISISILS